MSTIDQHLDRLEKLCEECERLRKIEEPGQVGAWLEAVRKFQNRSTPTVVRALVAIVRCADNYVNPTDDDDVRSMLAFADLKKALAALEGVMRGETIEKPRGTP